MKNSIALLITIFMIPLAFGINGAFGTDYKAALKHFKPLAEKGDISAQFNMGLMYENGHGVPKDDKKAIYWWTKSATQGYAKAQLLLGQKYHLGEGTPKNIDKAIHWYTKSAEQEFAMAQYNLGHIYESDMYGKENKKTSLYWYTKSAKNGNKDAQEIIGRLYFKGEEIPQNTKLAYMWLTISKQNGNRDAGEILNVISLLLTPKEMEKINKISKQCMKTKYKNCDINDTSKENFNKGFKAYNEGDYKTALHHIKKSATQGNPLAQFILSSMHYKGQSTPQDQKLAYMWITLAIQNNKTTNNDNLNDKKIKDIQKKIAKEMPPADINKAQEMSNRCLSSQYTKCGYE